MSTRTVTIITNQEEKGKHLYYLERTVEYFVATERPAIHYYAKANAKPFAQHISIPFLSGLCWTVLTMKNEKICIANLAQP